MAEGDQGHLHFPSLPEDRRKWPAWLDEISRISLGNIIIVRNAEQHQQRISYFAVNAFGRFWDVDQQIWSAEEADITRLTADAIIEHRPAMPVLVQHQLRLEAAQYHFENRQVHLQMQVRFRQALMQSLQGHSILVVMNPFNSDIQDTDLYQGSRFLKYLVDQFKESIEHHRVALGIEASRLASDLKAKVDASTAEALEVVSRLDEFIQLLRLAGPGADRVEEEYVRFFINVLKSDSSPYMLNAVRAAAVGVDGAPPNTISSLRKAGTSSTIRRANRGAGGGTGGRNLCHSRILHDQAHRPTSTAPLGRGPDHRESPKGASQTQDAKCSA